MGVYLMAACWLVARRRGYGAANRRATLTHIGATAWRAGPALLTPLFVIGSMVTGIATATEAAAIAALYSLVLALAYREMRWLDVQPMLTGVVVITAVIYLMLGVFNILSWILAIEQIPQAITHFFVAMTDDKHVVLLIINLVVLLCGMFMEPVPIIVLLGPILMPIVAKYGIDPVHFGLVFVLNILIGVVHPPIGTNMFIACSIARCTVGEFTREALPFIAALLLLLLLVTYVPEISLFLPRLLAR